MHTDVELKRMLEHLILFVKGAQWVTRKPFEPI
jgi:hypothetical protein